MERYLAFASIVSPRSAILLRERYTGAGADLFKIACEHEVEGMSQRLNDGTGVITLASASSAFSGGTTIDAGTLDLAATDTVANGAVSSGAAGTGAITFFGTGDHPATLAFDAVAQPVTGAPLD